MTDTGVYLSLPPVRDPDAEALVSAIRTIEQPSLAERGVQGAREYLEERAAAGPKGPDVDIVEDVTINAAGHSVPVRIYRADGLSGAPVVVYFHGGGWVIGSVTASDAFCRRVSSSADCVVVSVDYPLAPENPFPVPVDCAVAAIEWAAERVTAWGGSEERITVLGDSAGGNLATVAVRRLLDKGNQQVCRQILAYPGTSAERVTSGAHFGNEWPLTDGDRAWFMDQYVTSEHMRTNPEVAPLLADLTGLPPTTLLLGGCDPIAAEGLAYADCLWSAGVVVDLHLFSGQIHGFLTLDETILPRSREALGLVVNAIRNATK